MSNDGGEVAARATPKAPRATATPQRASGSVQSVDRALRVLEILADQGARGVTEIADELGVHKSTAFRLISVLEDHQLVEQVEDRGRYHLGFGIVRLAGATSAQLDLTRQSQPVCEDLATALDETVNIAVLEGSSVINISQARGGAAIASHNWVGQLTPPHATSSGKVLLAELTDAEVFALLPDPLPRYTDHTLTTRTRLGAGVARRAGEGVRRDPERARSRPQRGRRTGPRPGRRRHRGPVGVRPDVPDVDRAAPGARPARHRGRGARSAAGWATGPALG